MREPSQKSYTHSEALAIIRLMSDAYKAGVYDAEWLNDVGICTEHIAETQEKGVYGRVTDKSKSDWRRWKHNILLLKNDKLANVRAVEVTARIKNWFCVDGCLLPLVQDFYNQGLKDWNDNPVSRIFARMDKMTYPRWTRKGARQRSFKQMWVDMQEFAYKRMEQYEDVDSARSLTPRKFETFSISVWAALKDKSERKYLLNDN